MLSLLRIRNFAIIEELELELSQGFNVITGETGAGKSILVGALELLLGGKASGKVVRTGENMAEIEALFDLASAPELRAELEEAGFEFDDNELLLRRVVQANGRSRVYINGALATLKQLSDIAHRLADISSQHEHHSLTDPAGHLDILDSYADNEADREAMAAAFREAEAAHRALRELETKIADRAEREAFLRFQLEEIQKLGLRPGESEELAARRDKLSHAHRLIEAGARAEAALYQQDGSLSEQLGRIVDSLEKALEIDATLKEPVEALQQALALIEDTAKELGDYARSFDHDPGELEAIEERLDAIRRLERKHAGDIENILEKAEAMAKELESLESLEESLERQRHARDQSIDRAGKIAETLHRARYASAKKLGEAIGDELRSLGMGEARIEIRLEQPEGDGDALTYQGKRLGDRGFDRAELLIAPNRGEAPQPLRAIASGGELSRSLLAVKRVLSELKPAGLYIFDEVDTGVGGAIAEAIGEKIAAVAKNRQVLCISHLPQVAAFGEAHFLVKKETRGDRTVSTIVRLSDEERTSELARMLSGKEITDAAREAAATMLESAASVSAKAKAGSKPRRKKAG